MNKHITYIFFFIILFISSYAYSQVSNVNINHSVYEYLSTLSQKGIIDYDDLVKPLSRRYIASKLVEAREKMNKLTKLQKDELEFYEAEFGYEIKKQNSEFGIQNLELKEEEAGEGSRSEEKSNKVKEKRDLLDKSWEFEVRTGEMSKVKSETKNEETKNERFTFVKKDPYKRWQFFGYENNVMNLNVNPVLGYEVGNWEKDHYNNLFAGIKFYGELGEALGFNFELTHTRQTPGYINILHNRFSKHTKYDAFLADRDRLEYSKINVSLGYSWDWGAISFGKNHNTWGYAENGKIVLSDGPRSYPNIRLDIKPTDWLSFVYMHGWLNSDVLDSNSFYPTWRVIGDYKPERVTYISKFIAFHSFTITPIKNLDFSFGESVVYSDDLQLAYLIPIMFFDITDEYLNRNDNYAGGSTQLFLALSSKNHIPNTHLYGSFHADELTPDGLFDPKTQYYKFAFTFGTNTIDLPIDNLGLTLEYTKVYPGNYRHFIPTLTYESSSTILGHWIGDNGDLIYGAVNYTFFRGLKIKLWTQYIRKGTEAFGNRAYQEQFPQPGFLFLDKITDRKNYRYYGVDVNYEIFHDLWVKAHFQYIDFSQQILEDKFRSQLNRDFSLAVGYGI
ncbi:MAG: hypothetical protein H6609_16725 [Ignavibacteriales bacterium]|nr:hypothetical protein [Ignavibacteriales bacterium]